MPPAWRSCVAISSATASAAPGPPPPAPPPPPERSVRASGRRCQGESWPRSPVADVTAEPPALPPEPEAPAALPAPSVAKGSGMFTEKVRGLSVARVSGAAASAPPTKTPIIDVEVDCAPNCACGQGGAG
eukprot:scaffold67918_cov33-Phaeocystis_antarctica.AAC.1